MDRGWRKIWVKSIDSGMMQNHELWAFWCWCLLKATRKPCKVMVGLTLVELDPGQFVFGRKNAAQELDLSESKIYRLLKFLENSQNLNIKPNNKFSIVSIINWHIYQDDNRESEQQTEQQVNNKRTTSEQQANTKESIKSKRVKNKPLAPTPPNGSQHPEIFITIPTNRTGEEFPVTIAQIAEFQELYQGINVESEIKKCKAWNISNKTKRKTASGIMKHINGWLSRAQNTSGGIAPQARREVPTEEIYPNLKRIDG